MIRSIRDKRILSVLAGRAPKGFPSDLVRATQRKLQMLDSAAQLVDLASPPANHLEALKGNRKGQHSIRVNDKWRLMFRWREGPEDVELVDYH